MWKHMLMYSFLAVSKFNPARCEKRMLEAHFAHYEASLGAGSICYTYITTIIVTIAAYSTDSQDDATPQPPSSSPYLSDSLPRPTQTPLPTQTRGQVGQGSSPVGSPETPGGGTSDSRGLSTVATSKNIPVVSTDDASDILPSESQVSSTTPFNRTVDTSHDGGGPSSPDSAYPPSDASLSPYTPASETSAGAKTTIPAQTGSTSIAVSANMGHDSSTVISQNTTPRTSERPGDAESGTSITKSVTAEPTAPYPSTSKSSSGTISSGDDSTSQEGPTTKSSGTPVPAATKTSESNTISKGTSESILTSSTATGAASVQSAPVTTQIPSIPVPSTIILSIEATATPGPAVQTTTRLRPKIQLRKRDSEDGFVGNSQNPNTGSCFDAVRFRQWNGQLQRRGRPISVDPGVDYINILNYPDGSITTEFTVVNDTLQWTNDAFYDGRATFCQVGNDGPVYAVFTSAGGPEGCSPVALVVYRGTVSPSTR
ncbi:uncharacterized protein PG986_006278 [Apiospora aurea]|uniref:DUF7908 domain-containing protein n=1 Tax=Apiospora aurea TaxID=335848 RepID=A0ABR1QLG0_9PEZI